MARNTLLTPQMLAQIDNLLGIGCTIQVTCDQLGITRQTYYNWLNKSRELCAAADAHGRTLVNLEDVTILTFFDTVTRAQARAQVMATFAFRSAFVEHRTEEFEPYTYRETRMRKGKDGEEIPYTYEETRLRRVEKVTLPDWRAGLEYLKRRDPATWNPPAEVKVTFEDQAIAYIKAGEVQFWEMVEEFDDYDLVAELFARAGKIAPARESAPAQPRT